MECLVQVASHRFPVGANGIHHRRGRGLGRCKQGFNEADRLLGIQLNEIALIDDLARDFAGMGNDKGGHRAALNHCRSLEKLLVPRRNPGHESLGFLLFYNHFHVKNVCRTGTHCKHCLICFRLTKSRPLLMTSILPI